MSPSRSVSAVFGRRECVIEGPWNPRAALEHCWRDTKREYARTETVELLDNRIGQANRSRRSSAIRRYSYCAGRRKASNGSSGQEVVERRSLFYGLDIKRVPRWR